ncbi:hypothetical protein [Streptomyces lushanensis]|uniref:hypothetical protein n=1 Tax=Streptomyces lushanensis TaxID=1434255 RepID=UPI00082B15CF|nr:hypothetical protein [Streptomyces lushanensis]
MTSEPDRVTGSNIGLSEAELRAAFERALTAAKSVHVVGRARVDARVLALDLHLNKDGSAASTFVINGGECRIRAVAGSYYFHLSAAFVAEWLGPSGPAPQDLSPVVSRWWPATTALGNLLIEHLGHLASYDLFFRRMMADGTGNEVTAAGTALFDGERVALYVAEDGSTLHFAATGPAYLLRNTENDEQFMEFTWNQPVRVVAPEQGEGVRL